MIKTIPATNTTQIRYKDEYILGLFKKKKKALVMEWN